MKDTDFLEELYAKKGEGYFDNARKELLTYFEGKNKKVLDIGCGQGALLTILKELGIAKELVGVEIDKDSAKIAQKNLDKVFTGNIELIDLPYKNYFDYIIMADVLEHTIDPWKVIAKAKSMLKKGGSLIISIPNLRHLDVFKELFVKGKFEYKPSGLLDKGHLRFFTLKEMTKMLEDEGLEIIRFGYNFYPAGPKRKLFNTITNGKFIEFFALQHHFVAQKVK